MSRNSLIVPGGFVVFLCCCFVCAANVRAQTQVKLPADLQSLPEQIKTLQWQTIDMAGVTPLEQSRSLLYLDHVLSEVSANATAEADLMSAYIQQKKLGSDFANTPPPPAPKQLGFNDAQKIAVAMLRGPMSNSYYATELGDATPSSLASYADMYQRTCQRKWSEFDESRHLILCMGSYLGNNQKLQDYDAWATAEAAARQKQYEQQTAAANAGGAQAPAAQNQAQTQALQQQNQQLQQALGAAEYQQQSQSQQLAQSQQQTADAQQQAAQAQQQTAQAQQPQSTSSGYVAAVPTYGGYGAYAGAYAGAAAANTASAANAADSANKATEANAAKAAGAANTANTPTEQQKAAGAYHASNSTWNKDSSYSSAAHSQTEDRMSSFHGTSAGGGGYRGGGGRR